MPTPCWLKHLCSIRAWVPTCVFLSLSLSLSLYFWLIPWRTEARWAHFLAQASKTLSRRHTAFTHSRGRLVPTCSIASPKNRTLLALHRNQGISASFSLLLSYRWLRTARFWPTKGPTQNQATATSGSGVGHSSPRTMDGFASLKEVHNFLAGKKQNHSDLRRDRKPKHQDHQERKIESYQSYYASRHWALLDSQGSLPSV